MKKTILSMLVASSVLIFSCKDDDPTFGVSAGGEITATDYTMGGTPAFQYSTDAGTTYSADMPTNMGAGTTLLVKINNGTEDLLDTDFTFDWSASDPAPNIENAGIAVFSVNGNLTVNATIADKWTLLTSQKSGTFKDLDKSNGTTTDLFTFTYESSDLQNVRAFTYHYIQKSYYASVNSNAGGDLFKIDPGTKIATKINDNDGSDGQAIWDAVVNWVVAEDDSLMSVGDFNGDGNGIVKFGTDGGRSQKLSRANTCCGLGLVYDYDNEKFVIANGWNTNDGEIQIDDLALDGSITGVATITTFEGFPEDISNDWIPVRSMAKDMDGTVYAMMFDYDTNVTYFITIDINAKTATYINKMATTGNEAYHTLTFVPTYLL